MTRGVRVLSPTPPVVRVYGVVRLEVDTSTELERPGGTEAGDIPEVAGSCSDTWCGGVDGGVWVAGELRMVEQIECLNPDLEVALAEDVE